jgi:hypothetical protein
MRNGLVGRAGLAVIAALGLINTGASAQRVASGVMSNGTTWQAQSHIVGAGSTGTVASGGNPRYLATQPFYSGVVTLIMNYGAAGSFICSGTLLPDRVSILTAAHCVTEGPTLARPISTTVFFPDVTQDGVPAAGGTNTVGTRSVTLYNVHPNYTGEVIDQNDIAVLRMDSAAPAAARSYGLFNPTGLTGGDFNVAGYGARSSVGGAAGANLGTGRLRQGLNRYDFRFGDSQFGGFWTDRDPSGENFFGTAEIEFSYISDFDSGLAANDASCRLAGVFALGGAQFCNLGRGDDEVSTAGGDSGGPQFIDGQIAGFTSYGLSFGTGIGDIDTALNSSFGEFSGAVPVYIHTGFIEASMVPEPATVVLMLTGLAGIGIVARRRRRTV